jgi:hypothetical protein
MHHAPSAIETKLNAGLEGKLLVPTLGRPEAEPLMEASLHRLGQRGWASDSHRQGRPIQRRVALVTHLS